MIFVFDRSFAVGFWPSIQMYSALIFANVITSVVVGWRRIAERFQTRQSLLVAHRFDTIRDPPHVNMPNAGFESMTPIIRVHDMQKAIDYYTRICASPPKWADEFFGSIRRGRCHLFLAAGESIRKLRRPIRA